MDAVKACFLIGPCDPITENTQTKLTCDDTKRNRLKYIINCYTHKNTQTAGRLFFFPSAAAEEQRIMGKISVSG